MPPPNPNNKRHTLYAINPIARAMAFALESPDKKIRERVYEHFKEDKFRKFFQI